MTSNQPFVRYVHDDLTGKVLASRHFGYGAMEWDWIAVAVAEFNNCRSEDVDLIETDGGEIITVHGKPVARLEDN